MALSAERVAQILRCAECGRVWLPSDGDRWRALRIDDPTTGEPPELGFFCPDCAEREFGES